MSAQRPMPSQAYNPALVEIGGGGAAIRTRREQLGLTQRQVAIAMHERLGRLASEASCLRAVSEIEREARRFKSAHYTETLLRVLYEGGIAE